MLVEDIKNNTIKIYSVCELTANIKNMLKATFPALYIRGEISNLKLSSSKHLFFSLKDEKATINCVIFETDMKKIKFQLDNGLDIIAFGSVNVYEKGGSYNLVIKDALPEGKGSLQLAFEQLKEKLDKEGLFRRERKKSIPEYPGQIGIITALNGAALRDMLKIINRRFSNVRILIYPAVVQGENAGKTIIKGIEVFNSFFPVDVIILGRGGGSIEDLWAFNEESVARAIASSAIPVISAVGHEIDYTIADFVADLRAPTPSAAAEMVVKNKEDILKNIDFWHDKIENNVQDLFNSYRINFDLVWERYNNISKNILKAKSNQFDLIYQNFLQSVSLRLSNEKNRFFAEYDNFKNSVLTRFMREENRFANISGRLALLNPFLILERGYSITYRLQDNTIVKRSSDVKPDDKVKIKLHKGIIECNVEKVINEK